MTHVYRLASAAALIAVAATGGCKPKAQLNTEAADSSLVMSLERGPCRGTCPVYRVDVYGDGRVQFDGQRHVATIGTKTGIASVTAVQELLQKFRNGEFAKADSAYVMDSPGCGSYATDLPVSKLSAKIGAGMKTVEHDPGCRNAPAFLKTLAAQVDSVARTTQWIAGNGDAAK